MEKMDKDDETQTVALKNCGHEFHISCITQLREAKTAQNCPLCKTSLPKITGAEQMHTWTPQQLKNLQRNADLNHPEAVFMLSLVYSGINPHIKRDEVRMLDLTAKAAHYGHVSAQFNMACYAADGHFGRDDIPAKIFYWTQKAAEQGHANSQFNLSVFYFYGDGVEVNFAKAVEWAIKAKKNGYKDVQRMIEIFVKDPRCSKEQKKRMEA
jgi:hypothetical protein